MRLLKIPTDGGGLLDVPNKGAINTDIFTLNALFFGLE